MEAILRSTSSGSIAVALELVTANIANPTELNAIGLAVPDWRLVRTNVAGSDEATLYRLDADTDAVNAPYIMASATAGLRWAAISGRYQFQAQNIGATTAATTSLTGSNIIGNGVAAASVGIGAGAIYTGSHVVVGGALRLVGIGIGPVAGAVRLDRLDTTTTRFMAGGPNAGTTGALSIICSSSDDSIFTSVASFTLTNINIPITTSASSAIAGALTIGNGTAATNVALGSGRIWAGERVTVGSGTASASNIVIADGGASGAAAGGSMVCRNGGASIIGIGNYSALFGGAYDATPAIFASATIRIEAAARINSATAATSPITGGLVIGDGATLNTNVGIGAGSVVAGGSTGNACITAGFSTRALSTYVVVNSAAAQYRGFAFQTASNFRWLFACNDTAESGANAGSNFELRAYDDAGGFIDTPWFMARAAGLAMTVARPFRCTSTTGTSSPITGALIVGDGITSGSNVAIGGGAVYAGGNIVQDGSAMTITGSGIGAATSVQYRITRSGHTTAPNMIALTNSGNTDGAIFGQQGSSASAVYLYASADCTFVYGPLRTRIGGGTTNANNFIEVASGTAAFGSNVVTTFNNTTNGSITSLGGITTASTTLHTTTVALTNGAAAAAGTLANAPVAGNPTKWVPINDNGTTRYIPCW